MSRRYNVVLNRHAKKRAIERYDLHLSDKDLEDIVLKIQKGEAEFIENRTNTRALHKVNWDGITLLTLYSSSTKKVVTFLPINDLLAEE